MAAGRTVERGPAPLAARLLPAARATPTCPSSTRSTGSATAGRFTTRRVVAIQHGRAIFNLSASFHVDEPGPATTRSPCPRCPTPRRCRPCASGSSPTGTSSATGSTGPTPSTSATSATLPWMHRAGQEPVQRLWLRADGHPARRPAAPHLHRHLRLGHVPVRHHARPPRGGLGRRRLHGGQPRPLHVVPPALPGRRVAALRHGQPHRLRGPGPGPGLHVHPRRRRWSCRWSRRA